MKKNNHQRLSINASLAELATVRGFIERIAQDYEVQAEAFSDIRLAVDELLTNTILHGYNGAEGYIEIELQLESHSNNFVVIMRDQAPVFNPFNNVPQHNLAEKLVQAQPGGFGLQLVQRTMTKSYHAVTESGGNQLTLVKQF